MSDNTRNEIKKQRRAEAAAAKAAEARKKRTLKYVLIALAALAVIVGAVLWIKGAAAKKAKAFEIYEPTEKGVYARITVEDYGVITVKLDASKAPQTVVNFIQLADDHFYDGLSFHRIMDGFMMQGGAARTAGEKEYVIIGEFAANGYSNNDLSHTRGAISMARAEEYNSASTQFFICQSDAVYLDGYYACFGYTVAGMDVVDKICKDARPIDNNGTIREKDQPIMRSVEIFTVE